MEITPPVYVNLEQEQPQEQVDNTRAVIESIPKIEDLNPLVSSTPERDKKRKIEVTRNCRRRNVN